MELGVEHAHAGRFATGDDVAGARSLGPDLQGVAPSLLVRRCLEPIRKEQRATRSRNLQQWFDQVVRSSSPFSEQPGPRNASPVARREPLGDLEGQYIPCAKCPGRLHMIT